MLEGPGQDLRDVFCDWEMGPQFRRTDKQQPAEKAVRESPKPPLPQAPAGPFAGPVRAGPGLRGWNDCPVSLA
jgi:hypothetical protein